MILIYGKMRDQMLSGYNHLTSAVISLKYSIWGPRVEFLPKIRLQPWAFVCWWPWPRCAQPDRKFWLCVKLYIMTRVVKQLHDLSGIGRCFQPAVWLSLPWRRVALQFSFQPRTGSEPYLPGDFSSLTQSHIAA